MNELEMGRVFHAIEGYWPRPELTDNERHAIRKQLRSMNVDVDSAVQAIENLARNGGQKYVRPLPMTITEAVRNADSVMPWEVKRQPCKRCDGTTWVLVDAASTPTGPAEVARCGSWNSASGFCS